MEGDGKAGITAIQVSPLLSRQEIEKKIRLYPMTSRRLRAIQKHNLNAMSPIKFVIFSRVPRKARAELSAGGVDLVGNHLAVIRYTQLCEASGGSADIFLRFLHSLPRCVFQQQSERCERGQIFKKNPLLKLVAFKRMT